MNFATAREEIVAIVKLWPMWFMLGTQDIQLRYRRSALGPFWITISMAVTVYSMGFLYGHLFKIQLHDYFPYLASGIICWALLSSLILEGSNIFLESEGYIKNQDSFMSVFVMRSLLRNAIIFFHNLLVFIPIMFFCHMEISYHLFLIIPGLFLIALNVVSWGTVIAILGTRYRDFAQIISSLVQVIFFLTPVMWMPNLLPAQYQWVVVYNPFNQFLNLIRAPLLNKAMDGQDFLMILGISLVGFLLYAYFLRQYKNRIVFWL